MFTQSAYVSFSSVFLRFLKVPIFGVGFQASLEKNLYLHSLLFLFLFVMDAKKNEALNSLKSQEVRKEELSRF